MLLVLDKVVEVILSIKRNATPQKLYGMSEFFFGMKIQYSIKHQQTKLHCCNVYMYHKGHRL